MNIIVDPIATHAKAKPHIVAVGNAETRERITWQQLDDAINRAANWLLARLGPQSGARVAVLAKNDPLLLILQFACLRAGAVFVPYNWRLAAAEIDALMTDAEPVLLFHDAEFGLPSCACEQILLTDLPSLGTDKSPPTLDARQSTDAPTTLLYTSGTSGRPKGVMISEANAFWGNINFMLGSMVGHTSVFLCDMPMFHTAGLFAAVRVPILAGGMVWISRGFDPAKTLERMADPSLGITHYFSVPQMAATLWNQPQFKPEMLKNLVMYVTGGAPNPAAQVERFARAGIVFSDGFGMTETGSNFAMPADDVDTIIQKAGSCGLPLMMVQTRIVDEDGKEVAKGETGELLLQGPSITSGYWNQPEVTAAAFDHGWFKTGDAARQDEDGFFYLVDRKKDMYISGGENVYPAEVEAAIAEIEDVAECAVIGVPNEKWGEVGCAYIIARAGSFVTPEHIIAHCGARLAKFKVPASVIITDAIPRTASGKVQKHLLKR
jgi:fatty-acyl-CoA synthase